MSPITAEELGRLRIPLALLPGFDPIGALVRVAGCRGLVVGRDTARPETRWGEWLIHPLDEWKDLPLDCGTLVRSCRGSEAQIDLAESSTADRLSRWMALRLGMRADWGDCTAPRWYAAGMTPSTPWWVIQWGRESRIFASAAYHGARVIPVPDLHFDAGDARRLPDGSRFADRLALGTVAVHVGSTP